MKILTQFSSRPQGKFNLDEDLDDARQYLINLGGALLEAADSPDPRVVALGVELARYQGVNR